MTQTAHTYIDTNTQTIYISISIYIYIQYIPYIYCYVAFFCPAGLEKKPSLVLV